MTDAELDPAQPPSPCSPCRGTGRVVSNLGGAATEIACPWCEGTGLRTPGSDAQEHWRAQARPVA